MSWSFTLETDFTTILSFSQKLQSLGKNHTELDKKYSGGHEEESLDKKYSSLDKKSRGDWICCWKPVAFILYQEPLPFFML